MAFNIGDFLKKFKTLVPQEKIVKDEMIQVVLIKTGILLSKEEISFNNNVVFLKTTPATRNELFMRKQSILSEMKKRLADKSPQDIR